MQSLKEFYKIGPGPSSSHTMGPQRAALKFREAYPCAARIDVTLHGSLSLTGKGHLTDWIILKTLHDLPVEIFWDDISLPKHPNGMIFRGYDEDNKLCGEWIVYSVGGGSIVIDGLGESGVVPELYELNKLDDIYKYLNDKGMSLVDYVVENEGEEILSFLENIADNFIANTKRGLEAEGLIPGELKLERVAKKLYEKAIKLKPGTEQNRLKLLAYAYANAEENASGGQVVTAPTCGAAGIMPALVYHYLYDLEFSKEKIVESIAVAGIFGNLIKQNASISGAEGGCQAEVGTGCAMAAAAASYLEGLGLKEIEYAAEVAIEHHLGLTCDPVKGYVQIPCIERNGQAVLRAVDAMILSRSLADIRTNSVSFDTVVRTMKETGDDLKSEYRETALGGLATNFYKDNKLKK